MAFLSDCQRNNIPLYYIIVIHIFIPFRHFYLYTSYTRIVVSVARRVSSFDGTREDHRQWGLITSDWANERGVEECRRERGPNRRRDGVNKSSNEIISFSMMLPDMWALYL